MSYRNPTILLIVVAAIAAGLGLWLGQRTLASRASGEPIATQAALLYGAPRALSPFELTKSDGTPYTNANLQGRWTLAFFGFTRCPDVCPTTLASFVQLDKALAQHPSPPPVGYLFVSVDPERDTPEAAGNYARYFSPKIEAATGTQEALTAFTRELGILYMKSPGPGSTSTDGNDYTVDHSAQLVLIAPDGTMRGVFKPPLDPNRIAADLVTIAEHE